MRRAVWWALYGVAVIGLLGPYGLELLGTVLGPGSAFEVLLLSGIVAFPVAVAAATRKRWSLVLALLATVDVGGIVALVVIGKP